VTSAFAELADSLEAVVRRALPVEVLLAAAERGEPLTAEVTAPVLASGLLDVAVGEPAGGLGLDTAAVAEICVAAGRALLPASWLHAALLTAPLLAEVPSPEARDALEGLRAGRLAGGGGASAREAALHLDGDVLVVDGVSTWCGGRADVIALAGPDLAAVIRTSSPTVTIQAPLSIDPGQGLRVVSGRVPAADCLMVIAGRPATEHWHRWQLGICSQALGAAEEATVRSIAYARQREQFGRPIAEFQAVAHTLADMHVGVTVGRSVLARAAALLDDGAPGAAPALLAMAHWLPQRARVVCERAIQVHGGNGFSWEFGLHLFYRRVLAVQAALGGAGGTARQAARGFLTG
jgi:alkylation response protein AidB-like acyl-CoA dehydrogenase